MNNSTRIRVYSSILPYLFYLISFSFIIYPLFDGIRTILLGSSTTEFTMVLTWWITIICFVWLLATILVSIYAIPNKYIISENELIITFIARKPKTLQWKNIKRIELVSTLFRYLDIYDSMDRNVSLNLLSKKVFNEILEQYKKNKSNH